jgi:hypothetical protein
MYLWLGLHDVDPWNWRDIAIVKEWWVSCIHKRGQPRKAMASPAMHISWKFWKEQNARVFWNHSSTSAMVVTKVKDEAQMWCLTGAKALSIVIPRE